MNWKLIDKALAFASAAHKEDKRKGTEIPYIIHPIGVSMLLLQAGYNTEVVIAGLLHDTIEDTSVTGDDIESAFGKQVRNIVEGCSEPDKSLTWEERKQHTIEILANVSNEIRWVTCADKLHNIRSMYEEYQLLGEELWSKFKRGKEKQAWYYRGIVDSLSKGDFFNLLDELREVVDLLFGNTE
jgi:(p)ppGpp synthase/HD superfamily hydrolase